MIPSGLIGVVHLPPLPGDPAHTDESAEAIVERALSDARALTEGGVAGLIVENFGSAPFYKGTESERASAHTVALMTRTVLRIQSELDLPLGVNCLRNDASSALGIAAATGASFIRVNVHTGAYVTDQGLIEGRAAATLRERKLLGASVEILADVLVKHAVPLAPLDPATAATEALERGGADGVIVTGAATGTAPASERLEAVRTAAGDRPVLLGSGLTPDNAPQLLPHVDAAIVGTFFKRNGDIGAPVDVERVRRLWSAARGHFR